MKQKVSLIVLSLSLGLAGAALAHTGVKNPAVMARMHAMKGIGAEMKTLGQMAKSELPFDAEEARSAASTIAKHAGETPALFEAQEDDPKSEAKDEIWQNFEDFSAKSEELERIALGLAETISTKSDMTAAVKSLGATCLACHKTYREKTP